MLKSVASRLLAGRIYEHHIIESKNSDSPIVICKFYKTPQGCQAGDKTSLYSARPLFCKGWQNAPATDPGIYGVKFFPDFSAPDFRLVIHSN